MFTAWPDADGLPAAVGMICAGANVGAAVCAVGRGAAWVGAADERGHRRKAPSPARASTIAANATFRCADVRSMGPGVTSGGGQGAARTVLAGRGPPPPPPPPRPPPPPPPAPPTPP